MTDQTIHATTVAWQGKGALILGASGRGKSGLALALMALGADLVSDDRTVLTAGPDGLWAAPPPAIAGMIEARGVGLLRAAHLPQARVALCVDLDQTETRRLPDPRHVPFLGCDIPCLHKVDSPYFAAAILQYLKAGPKALS